MKKLLITCSYLFLSISCLSNNHIYGPYDEIEFIGSNFIAHKGHNTLYFIDGKWVYNLNEDTFEKLSDNYSYKIINENSDSKYLLIQSKNKTNQFGPFYKLEDIFVFDGKWFAVIIKYDAEDKPEEIDNTYDIEESFHDYSKEKKYILSEKGYTPILWHNRNSNSSYFGYMTDDNYRRYYILQNKEKYGPFYFNNYNNIGLDKKLNWHFLTNFLEIDESSNKIFHYYYLKNGKLNYQFTFTNYFNQNSYIHLRDFKISSDGEKFCFILEKPGFEDLFYCTNYIGTFSHIKKVGFTSNNNFYATVFDRSNVDCLIYNTNIITNARALNIENLCYFITKTTSIDLFINNKFVSNYSLETENYSYSPISSFIYIDSLHWGFFYKGLDEAYYINITNNIIGPFDSIDFFKIDSNYIVYLVKINGRTYFCINNEKHGPYVNIKDFNYICINNKPFWSFGLQKENGFYFVTNGIEFLIPSSYCISYCYENNYFYLLLNHVLYFNGKKIHSHVDQVSKIAFDSKSFFINVIGYPDYKKYLLIIDNEY